MSAKLKVVPGRPVTLAAALRECVAARGVRVTNTQAALYLKEYHPDISYRPTTLNSTLSVARKKAGGGGPAPSPWKEELTLPTLLRLAPLVREVGGTEEVLGMLGKVRCLADEAGGLDKLEEALEALRGLGFGSNSGS